MQHSAHTSAPAPVSDPPAGEPLAFRQLFETHAEALRRYAQRIVRSREMAEDVVQDVFLRLWRVWGRVEIGPGTRAYLYVTTRSRALNCLKREQSEERRRYLGVPRGILSDEPALPPEGDANVDADEIVRAIERVLATMPPRQREVAGLRLHHQLTMVEIAHRLEISPRTVEIHISRATKALRAQLPALLPDGPRVPPVARRRVARVCESAALLAGRLGVDAIDAGGCRYSRGRALLQEHHSVVALPRQRRTDREFLHAFILGIWGAVIDHPTRLSSSAEESAS